MTSFHRCSPLACTRCYFIPTSCHRRHLQSWYRSRHREGHRGCYLFPCSLDRNLNRNPSSWKMKVALIVNPREDFLCSWCLRWNRNRHPWPWSRELTLCCQLSRFPVASNYSLHNLMSPCSECLNLLHLQSIQSTHLHAKHFQGETFLYIIWPALSQPQASKAAGQDPESVWPFLWWQSLDPSHPHNMRTIACSATWKNPSWDPERIEEGRSSGCTPWQSKTSGCVSTRMWARPASASGVPQSSNSYRYILRMRDKDTFGTPHLPASAAWCSLCSSSRSL